MLELPNRAAEHALVVRCLRGDRKAQADLFAQYHPLLKNALAHHFAPNPQRFELAEDLAQGVFAILVGSGYRRLRRFLGGPVPLLTFLEQMAFLERSHERRSPQGNQQSHEVPLKGDKWEDHRLDTFSMVDIEDFWPILTPNEKELITELLGEKADTSTPVNWSPARQKAMYRLLKKLRSSDEKCK